MPFSSSSGKAYITNVIQNLPDSIKRKPVLDIGAGSGTYSNLFKGMLTGPWTGVEAYQPYVEEFDLKSKYEFLQVADIREIELFRNFGVIFLGDILEHMTAEQAYSVLEKAKEVADIVIVSIPIGYYPQDAYGGNTYEIHIVDNWTDAAFIEKFGRPTISKVENGIGVYIYAKYGVMKKPKIAVYAIAKNEEMFVERFCNSAKDADYIVIADTGSVDNTIAKSKEFTSHVYSISIQPWRFDHARNASLALVPSDADICICLDLDEVMVDGWRGMVERAWKGATRLRYKFDWSNGVLFYSDKIHSRAGYSWIHPCHEVLKYNGTEQMATIHDLLIVHKPDNSKSRGSYLGLLEMAYKETPDDPRTMLYYGRELSFYGNHGEALQVLRKYVDRDNYLPEKAYACSLIGKAFLACGNHVDAELYLLRGVYYDGSQRRGLCDLAEFYQARENWPLSKLYAEKALAIKERAMVYTEDPLAWTHRAYDALAIACHYMGKTDRAIVYGQFALDHSPDDERLKKNMEFYSAAA